MDERGLKYFEAVVKFGGIRGASELLHVTPSAISRQVKLLELQLKVRLLDRVGRRVEVTPAGERLMQHIKSVQLLEDDFKALLCDMEGLRVGTIRIATGGGFISDLITGALASFAKRYSGIRYVVTVCAGDEVIRRVRDDEVDIGLALNSADSPQTEILVSCSSQPLSVIVHPKSPQAKLQQLAFTQLPEIPLALLNDSFTIRHLIGRFEAQHHLRLQAALESNSFESVKLFVLSGLGVTLLPTFCVAREIKEGALKAVPLTQVRGNATSVDLIIRKGRQQSARIIAISKHIEEHMVAFRPGA